MAYSNQPMLTGWTAGKTPAELGLSDQAAQQYYQHTIDLARAMGVDTTGWTAGAGGVNRNGMMTGPGMPPPVTGQTPANPLLAGFSGYDQNGNRLAQQQPTAEVAPNGYPTLRPPMATQPFQNMMVQPQPVGGGQTDQYRYKLPQYSVPVSAQFVGGIPGNLWAVPRQQPNESGGVGRFGPYALGGNIGTLFGR